MRSALGPLLRCASDLVSGGSTLSYARLGMKKDQGQLTSGRSKLDTVIGGESLAFQKKIDFFAPVKSYYRRIGYTSEAWGRYICNSEPGSWPSRLSSPCLFVSSTEIPYSLTGKQARSKPQEGLPILMLLYIRRLFGMLILVRTCWLRRYGPGHHLQIQAGKPASTSLPGACTRTYNIGLS